MPEKPLNACTKLTAAAVHSVHSAATERFSTPTFVGTRGIWLVTSVKAGHCSRPGSSVAYCNKQQAASLPYKQQIFCCYGPISSRFRGTPLAFKAFLHFFGSTPSIPDGTIRRRIGRAFRISTWGSCRAA